jgi:hypothetical protein
MFEIPMHYILEGKVAKPTDFLTWAMWYGSADRTVARTEIENVIVSTVFFGLDFSFGTETVPELFETMILGGELDGTKIRCATWEQAEELHERHVQMVKAEMEDHTLDAEILVEATGDS